MKVKVLGVKSFPQKGKFIVYYDGGSYESEKVKTYGANPNEFWCNSPNLLTAFTDNIGKVVNVSFDYNRNIDSVNY